MIGLWRLRNRVGRHLLEWRSRRAYVRRWQGGPLLVEPGVLDPVATRVGDWLACLVAAEARPGERWLDMGAGTGAVGLLLAAKGVHATCADIDPRCVQNATENARRRRVPLEVVQSDHFAALGGRRFDGVAYNVPFWPGEPGDGPFDRAFFGGEDFRTLRRFVAEAPTYSDRVLVALSEAGALHADAVRVLGPAVRVHRERVSGEWLTLWRLRRSS